MSHRIDIILSNAPEYFYFQALTPLTTMCGVCEANSKLKDFSLLAGVLVFYEKNGFIPNAEFHNKNRKTISMRKDIYK